MPYAALSQTQPAAFPDLNRKGTEMTQMHLALSLGFGGVILATQIAFAPLQGDIRLPVPVPLAAPQDDTR
jgi:hypothetical protein